jgi:hypothetical protein
MSEMIESPEHMNMIMESMEEGEEHHHVDRFKIIVAILLGLVTILGGFVAWRAAIASEHAGIADLAGLAATVNVAETQTLDQSLLYEHYRAYTDYVRNNEIQKLLDADIAAANGSDVTALQAKRDEAATNAAQSSTFFPLRYLNRDGTYNTDRELGAARSDAARDKDLNPDPHLSEADALRAKASSLVAVLIVLAVAIWFFTLAEITGRRSRYLFAAIGVLAMLAATGSTLLIEIPM